MSVDVDDTLLRATIPSTMEVGETYPIRFRIQNNGTVPGEFTAVLWCESSALYPQIANMQFILRPGQAVRVNFTLTGVRPTDERTMVRTMVLATPSTKIRPLMLWKDDAVIQRVYPSETALAILITSITLASVLAIAYFGWWRLVKKPRNPKIIQSTS